MKQKNLAVSTANDNTNSLESVVANNLTDGNAALNAETISQTGILNIFDLPEYLKTTSLEEIFEKGRISDEDLEKLKESHANDNFPNLPTDPNELTDLLNQVELSVKQELLLLKTSPLSEEEYAEMYNKIQLKRAYQLLTEFMIGQDLKSIDKQYGLKKGSNRRKKDGKISKADIIKQRYPHLGPRQIRDFQHLELKYIWEAIVYAFSTGQELTRSLALSPTIKKRANNLPKPLPSNMERWYAKNGDFETEFKTLELLEEMGATSLFANIGCGTSLLEKYTKIRITVANEWKPRRAKAHQRLYPDCNVIEGSINDDDVFNKVVAEHKAHKNKICFISCPCQDASNFNTAASKGKGERAALFKASLDFIEETMPDYITFENVPQWLESRPEFALNILGDIFVI